MDKHQPIGIAWGYRRWLEGFWAPKHERSLWAWSVVGILVLFGASFRHQSRGPQPFAGGESPLREPRPMALPKADGVDLDRGDPSGLTSHGTVTGARAELLDLNSAPGSELDALPGLGPVLVGRILTERAKRPFTSLADVEQRVVGIGPKLIARLQPFVVVRPQRAESPSLPEVTEGPLPSHGMVEAASEGP